MSNTPTFQAPPVSDFKEKCSRCARMIQEDTAMYCGHPNEKFYCIDMRDKDGICGPQAIYFIRRELKC